MKRYVAILILVQIINTALWLGFFNAGWQMGYAEGADEGSRIESIPDPNEKAAP